MNLVAVITNCLVYNVHCVHHVHRNPISKFIPFIAPSVMLAIRFFLTEDCKSAIYENEYIRQTNMEDRL